MDLAALLSEFGAKLGIHDLGLDEGGQCSILFDDEHEVTFAANADDQSILMFGDVGSAGNLDQPACRELLEASFLGTGTGGGALGVHRDTNQIILWKRLDDNLPDLPAFENAINAFLPYLIDWKARLA